MRGIDHDGAGGLGSPIGDHLAAQIRRHVRGPRDALIDHGCTAVERRIGCARAAVAQRLIERGAGAEKGIEQRQRVGQCRRAPQRSRGGNRERRATHGIGQLDHQVPLLFA